jgi:DNA (cytosine-5)-methyltransferase 1
VRAISLFSGVGGFEKGFERAGVETVLQAESDPWCLEVLARHWPDTERVTDVRSVGSGLPERATQRGLRDVATGQSGHSINRLWGIDLVYGGFPCQDVSVAGKRAGLRGERSGLWHEFRRVLSELRPRWTVIENVPGLLSSNEGRDFGTILYGLEELGYGWAYRVLDARFFGVPQRRRRVFIVGCLGDAARAAQVLALCEGCGGNPAPRRTAGQRVAFTLAGGSPETSRRISNAWNTDYLAFGGNNTSRAIGVASARSSRANRYDFDTDTFLTNQAGVRRLTPRECNRLQGFSDDWDRWTADGREIPDSHRYRMMGNAVAIPCVEWVGHRLVLADQWLREAAA